MNHIGQPQEGLPLFNDIGVSRVECDNIPALSYPLMDWSSWAKTAKKAGLKRISKIVYFRWPYDCTDFTVTRSKSGWPSLLLKHEVMKGGCHIVPKIPRKFG